MSIQEIKNRVLANDVGGIIQKTLQKIVPGADITVVPSEGEDLKFSAKFRKALTLNDVNRLVQLLRSSMGSSFAIAGIPDYTDSTVLEITVTRVVTSDLTKKQEQLDVNEDGKIDSTDLKKLREGKKPGDEKEEARIKGDDEYSWFQFTGAKIEATNDKGRTLRLVKDDKFGARKSSNGKLIRLVTEKDGLTKVFTCDMDLAVYLGKNCKQVRASTVSLTAKLG